MPVFVLMAVFGTYGSHLSENAAPGSPAVNVAEIERKALGEKAPTDEAWISPFGPLTTKAAKAAGLTTVVFDRAGRRYHGTVKSFAEAARQAGLTF